MSLLQIATQLASSNEKTMEYMRVLRIKDSNVMAWDGQNVLKLSNMPFTGIDCTVAAKDLVEALKIVEEPILTQQDKELVLSNGTFEAKIALSDIEFPFEFSYAPGYDEDEQDNHIIDAEDFYKVIKYSLPLLQAAENSFSGESGQAYITGSSVYVTNGQFAFRMKTTADFIGLQAPITFGKEFAGYAKAIMSSKKGLSLDTPKQIRYSANKFALIWDDVWIETVRHSGELPIAFDEYFQTIDAVETEALSEADSAHIKKLCTQASAKDDIVFKNDEVVLNKGNSQYKLKISLPQFEIRAKELLTVLESGDSFNFSNPSQVVIKGETLTGVWSTHTTQQTQEIEEEVMT